MTLEVILAMIIPVVAIIVIAMASVAIFKFSKLPEKLPFWAHSKIKIWNHSQNIVYLVRGYWQNHNI